MIESDYLSTDMDQNNQRRISDEIFRVSAETLPNLDHEINKTSIAETNAHCTNHGSEQITDYLNNICDVADLGINKTLIEEKSTDGTNLGTGKFFRMTSFQMLNIKRS